MLFGIKANQDDVPNTAKVITNCKYLVWTTDTKGTMYIHTSHTTHHHKVHTIPEGAIPTYVGLVTVSGNLSARLCDICSFYDTGGYGLVDLCQLSKLKDAETAGFKMGSELKEEVWNDLSSTV